VTQLSGLTKPATCEGLGFLWSLVPATAVKDFIRGFVNHDEASMKTQADPVIRYIEAQGLETWDVCLYNPLEAEGATAPIEIVGAVHEAFRTAELKSTKSGTSYFAVSGASSRVASRGAERAGLSDRELLEAKAAYGIAADTSKNIGDRWYRQQRKRPLLMLHVLKLEYESDDSGACNSLNHVVAWGISLPATKQLDTAVEYVVNTTWWNENFGEDLDEYEDELNVAS
jgi:hypothetical protein